MKQRQSAQVEGSSPATINRTYSANSRYQMIRLANVEYHKAGEVLMHDESPPQSQMLPTMNQMNAKR